MRSFIISESKILQHIEWTQPRLEEEFPWFVDPGRGCCQPDLNSSLGVKPLFHVLSSLFTAVSFFNVSILWHPTVCISCHRSPQPPSFYLPPSLQLSILRYQACQRRFTAVLGGVHIWILFKGNHPEFLPSCWQALRDINHLVPSSKENVNMLHLCLRIDSYYKILFRVT